MYGVVTKIHPSEESSLQNLQDLAQDLLLSVLDCESFDNERNFVAALCPKAGFQDEEIFVEMEDFICDTVEPEVLEGRP